MHFFFCGGLLFFFKENSTHLEIHNPSMEKEKNANASWTGL